jgi:hypothetical protein
MSRAAPRRFGVGQCIDAADIGRVHRTGDVRKALMTLWNELDTHSVVYDHERGDRRKGCVSFKS